jgi:hypothetical protein
VYATVYEWLMNHKESTHLKSFAVIPYFAPVWMRLAT